MIPERIHSEIVRHSVYVDRYASHLQKEVLGFLRSLRSDVTKQLEAAQLDLTATDYRKKRLAQILAKIDEKIFSTYSNIDTFTNDALFDFAEVTSKAVVSAFNRAVGVELLSPVGWTSEELSALVGSVMLDDAPVAAWWSRQGEALSNAFRTELQKGLAMGETSPEIVRRVRGLLDTSARGSVESLVRTAITSTASAAHHAAYEANSDIIAGESWCATLDSRACIRCGALDGRVWPLRTSHTRPALHRRCRCVLLPVTKSWEKLAKEAGGNTALARKLDKIPAGERASMDGPVSASMTYETWLRKQSAAVQEEILGPGKLALYRKGRLTVSELLDNRGNPLTLEELRRKT